MGRSQNALRVDQEFERLKLKVSSLIFVIIRYLTLKQILPQLEQFESGFEDELTWLEEALVALEAYKNVNTLEEVERELGRYTVSRQLKRKVKYH